MDVLELRAMPPGTRLSVVAGGIWLVLIRTSDTGNRAWRLAPNQTLSSHLLAKHIEDGYREEAAQ